MKLRRLLPLLLVALLLAGCGGGGAAKLAPDDIAVVDTHHITVSAYEAALAEQEAGLKDEGEKVPAAGSTSFATLKTNIIDALVQEAELELQAAKLGIAVTPAELDKEMVAFKKKCCQGNEKKYLSGLKEQGYTNAEIEQSLQEKLLNQKLYDNVTESAKATNAEVEAYYEQNISTYTPPEKRRVEEILVGKKKLALATTIYDKLKAGASFKALALEYSHDLSSKDKGGKFTAVKGKDVPQFDAAVFSPTAKTGVLLKPVDTTQYGWFVIEPLTNIVSPKPTPEKLAAPKIRKTLNPPKEEQAATDWLTKVEKSYCSGKIAYQAGYTPSPNPCTTLSTSEATTT